MDSVCIHNKLTMHLNVMIVSELKCLSTLETIQNLWQVNILMYGFKNLCVHVLCSGEVFYFDLIAQCA